MRVEKGLDRHELAQATGVSYSSLYRLESGLVKSPPLWWYQNCAIALGVKLDDILDYEHSRWHATPQAPAPPKASWLKTKTQGERPGDHAAPPAKQDLRREPRLRKSALAAKD